MIKSLANHIVNAMIKGSWILHTGRKSRNMNRAKQVSNILICHNNNVIKTLETYFVPLYFWIFTQILNGIPGRVVFAHMQEAIKKSMYSQKEQPVAILASLLKHICCKPNSVLIYLALVYFFWHLAYCKPAYKFSQLLIFP